MKVAREAAAEARGELRRLDVAAVGVDDRAYPVDRRLLCRVRLLGHDADRDRAAGALVSLEPAGQHNPGVEFRAGDGLVQRADAWVRHRRNARGVLKIGR